MPMTTRTRIARFLGLAEALRLGRDKMQTPQDLPGRFGRAVKAIDRVLAETRTEAVLAGGWAVWRHGFEGRMTQDVDVALAVNQLPDFIQVAAVSGFDVLPVPHGRWPKLVHRDTGIEVDLLVEVARPGTNERPAPTVIPNPKSMGASQAALVYIALPSLIEPKLAAGRPKDNSDIVELIRANTNASTEIRHHLASVHADYVATFEKLMIDAEQVDP